MPPEVGSQSSCAQNHRTKVHMQRPCSACTRFLTQLQCLCSRHLLERAHSIAHRASTLHAAYVMLRATYSSCSLLDGRICKQHTAHLRFPSPGCRLKLQELLVHGLIHLHDCCHVSYTQAPKKHGSSAVVKHSVCPMLAVLQEQIRNRH